MAKAEFSIAVVAPANRLSEEAAAKVSAIATDAYGDRLNLFFHPQCFLSSGHFAGTDAERSAAFLEVANDPAFNAVWFARGGYGSCRLQDAVFGKLDRAAHIKEYMGYSDLGAMLGRLSREGVGLVHSNRIDSEYFAMELNTNAGKPLQVIVHVVRHLPLDETYFEIGGEFYLRLGSASGG